jgi:hypothetical protein
MSKRIAYAAVAAALFGFTSAALAVAEAEPETGASDTEAMAEGEPMPESSGRADAWRVRDSRARSWTTSRSTRWRR